MRSVARCPANIGARRGRDGDVGARNRLQGGTASAERRVTHPRDRQPHGLDADDARRRRGARPRRRALHAARPAGARAPRRLESGVALERVGQAAGGDVASLGRRGRSSRQRAPRRLRRRVRRADRLHRADAPRALGAPRPAPSPPAPRAARRGDPAGTRCPLHDYWATPDTGHRAGPRRRGRSSARAIAAVRHACLRRLCSADPQRSMRRRQPCRRCASCGASFDTVGTARRSCCSTAVDTTQDRSPRRGLGRPEAARSCDASNGSSDCRAAMTHDLRFDALGERRGRRCTLARSGRPSCRAERRLRVDARSSVHGREVASSRRPAARSRSPGAPAPIDRRGGDRGVRDRLSAAVEPSDRDRRGHELLDRSPRRSRSRRMR